MDSHARAHRSLAVQVVRALRLDRSLFFEVAVPGASNRQSVAVILVAAVASGVTAIIGDLLTLVRSYTAGIDLGTVVAQVAPANFITNGIGVVLAWIVTATGYWIVGKRWAAPDHPTPDLPSVARALAFAQTPTIVGLILVLLVTAIGFFLGTGGLRTGFLTLIESWSGNVIRVWVWVATFLATHEALRLSNGRTLGTLAIVHLTLVVPVLSVAFLLVLSGALSPSIFGL